MGSFISCQACCVTWKDTFVFHHSVLDLNILIEHSELYLNLLLKHSCIFLGSFIVYLEVFTRLKIWPFVCFSSQMSTPFLFHESYISGIKMAKNIKEVSDSCKK